MLCLLKLYPYDKSFIILISTIIYLINLIQDRLIMFGQNQNNKQGDKFTGGLFSYNPNNNTSLFASKLSTPSSSLFQSKPQANASLFKNNQKVGNNTNISLAGNTSLFGNIPNASIFDKNYDFSLTNKNKTGLFSNLNPFPTSNSSNALFSNSSNQQGSLFTGKYPTLDQLKQINKMNMNKAYPPKLNEKYIFKPLNTQQHLQKDKVQNIALEDIYHGLSKQQIRINNIYQTDQQNESKNIKQQKKLPQNSLLFNFQAFHSSKCDNVDNLSANNKKKQKQTGFQSDTKLKAAKKTDLKFNKELQTLKQTDLQFHTELQPQKQTYLQFDKQLNSYLLKRVKKLERINQYLGNTNQNLTNTNQHLTKKNHQLQNVQKQNQVNRKNFIAEIQSLHKKLKASNEKFKLYEKKMGLLFSKPKSKKKQPDIKAQSTLPNQNKPSQVGSLFPFLNSQAQQVSQLQKPNQLFKFPLQSPIAFPTNSLCKLQNESQMNKKSWNSLEVKNKSIFCQSLKIQGKQMNQLQYKSNLYQNSKQIHQQKTEINANKTEINANKGSLFNIGTWMKPTPYINNNKSLSPKIQVKKQQKVINPVKTQHQSLLFQIKPTTTQVSKPGLKTNQKQKQYQSKLTIKPTQAKNSDNYCKIAAGQKPQLPNHSDSDDSSQNSQFKHASSQDDQNSY